MAPRVVWFTRATGVALMMCVWATVIVNYGIAAGCGEHCYGERGSPLQFPEHLFISTTLRRSPTRFTGLAGFSLAALLALMMAVGRYLQIWHLSQLIAESVPRDRLQLLNRRSMMYIVVATASLVTLCSFPPTKDASPRTVIHYTSALVFFATFVAFIAIQISRVEQTLVALIPEPNSTPDAPLIPPSTPTSDVLRSMQFKRRCLWGLTGAGMGLLGATSVWSSTSEGAAMHSVMGVIAPTCELVIVLMGSSFVALSDFTSVQSLYSHHLEQLPQSQSL